MSAILPDFFPDLDACLAALPLKPPAGRAMSQDEFFVFCQQNRKLRFERTAEGELILNPPVDLTSGIRIVAVASQLYSWTKAERNGTAFGSIVGYILSNKANRSPVASWISPKQMATITRVQMMKFIPLCPNFVVELVSLVNRLENLQRKMDEYLANGCQLGWLIDPDNKQVYVYRPGQPVQVLDNPPTVSGDPELPGFVLDLEPVWRP